jgi:hypothetical protein
MESPTFQTDAAFYSLKKDLLTDIDRQRAKIRCTPCLCSNQTKRLRRALAVRLTNQPIKGPISIPINNANTVMTEIGSCGPAQPKNSKETDCWFSSS